MTSRPDFDEYFMALARVAANRSTCARAPDGVGCVLVRDRHVLGLGYCGSLAGQPHCVDPGVGCLIDEATGGCQRSVHAEQNAVVHARTDLRGATAYVTMSPCVACFKLLAAAGVVRIVYAREYRVGVEVQRALAPRVALEPLAPGRRA